MIAFHIFRFSIQADLDESVLRAVVLDSHGGKGAKDKSVDRDRTRQTALYLLEVKAWCDARVGRD